MEVVPRGGPHRRLIPRRLENPEEADYTSQRMHFCSAAAVPASLLLRRVILGYTPAGRDYALLARATQSTPEDLAS